MVANLENKNAGKSLLCRLLSDTKLAKHIIKQIIVAYLTGYGAEVMKAAADIEG